MNPDGSGETRVTNALGTDSRCDWQPIPRPGAPGGGGQAPADGTPGGGGQAPADGTPGGGSRNDARVRPNLLRPESSARQPARKVVVDVRGRMRGARGRSCVGRVKIGVRFPRNRRVTRIARIAADCRYSKRVAFPVRRLPRAMRARSKALIVRVAVRFQGNAGLEPDVSPTRRVKVRR
jgi:hypothetical protein